MMTKMEYQMSHSLYNLNYLGLKEEVENQLMPVPLCLGSKHHFSLIIEHLETTIWVVKTLCNLLVDYLDPVSKQ